MQERAPGGGELRVGAVGFGAMPLSILGRPDEDVALGVIHAALEAGVTFLDSADVYSLDGTDIGHNERLIAKALATWDGDRERVIVGTKGGSTHPSQREWRPDGRPEHLQQACDASLRALGVERIDLYSLHSPDPQVPYADSLGALAELHAAGKIRRIGICNVGVEHIRLARKIVPLSFVQNMLSLYERSALHSRPWRRGVLAPRSDLRRPQPPGHLVEPEPPRSPRRASDRRPARRVASRHRAGVGPGPGPRPLADPRHPQRRTPARPPARAGPPALARGVAQPAGGELRAGVSPRGAFLPRRGSPSLSNFLVGLVEKAI